MDPLHRTKKPVLPSHLSAHLEVDQWTRNNEFDTIMDGDALEWKLVLKHEELPNALGDDLQWQATFYFTATVTGSILTKTHTLDPIEDARLLELLDTDEISLRLKPNIIHASNSSELKNKVSQALYEYKHKLSSARLRDYKRRVVGRWIDAQRQFK